MMNKRNKKGFTLAELLIVVAIIAVLVAIAIPVFTSQLEKSREATDLSNIRSAYAEVVTAILTGDLDKDSNSVKVANNLAVTGKVNPNADFTITVKSLPMQQKQNDWQTADVQIAGVAIKSTTFTAATTTDLSLVFTHATDGDALLKEWSVGSAG